MGKKNTENISDNFMEQRKKAFTGTQQSQKELPSFVPFNPTIPQCSKQNNDHDFTWKTLCRVAEHVDLRSSCLRTSCRASNVSVISCSTSAIFSYLETEKHKTTVTLLWQFGNDFLWRVKCSKCLQFGEYLNDISTKLTPIQCHISSTSANKLLISRTNSLKGLG